MAKITKTMVGESLVGEGNEVAHIDLLIGPRGGPVEAAFCNSLTNNKDGFTSLLAVVAPNLPCKPNTVMFNKVKPLNADGSKPASPLLKRTRITLAVGSTSPLGEDNV